MKDILTEAREIIHGDREKTYGNPAHNLETIAELWRVYMERKHGVLIAFLPDDVATMMIFLKLARLMRSPGHRDSLVDIAGYAGLIDKCNTPPDTPLFANGGNNEPEGLQAPAPHGTSDDSREAGRAVLAPN